MTEQLKKLLKKNAEFGFDITEDVKASTISKYVHKGYTAEDKKERKAYTTDAECAILRKTVNALIGILNGELDAEKAAPILAEFAEYYDRVEYVKSIVKEEMGGAV